MHPFSFTYLFQSLEQIVTDQSNPDGSLTKVICIFLKDSNICI